jgi:hypothetical protein
MGEEENAAIARAALSTAGRAESNFLSIAAAPS